jgi:hypothetical protein
MKQPPTVRHAAYGPKALKFAPVIGSSHTRACGTRSNIAARPGVEGFQYMRQP